MSVGIKDHPSLPIVAIVAIVAMPGWMMDALPPNTNWVQQTDAKIQTTFYSWIDKSCGHGGEVAS